MDRRNRLRLPALQNEGGLLALPIPPGLDRVHLAPQSQVEATCQALLVANFAIRADQTQAHVLACRVRALSFDHLYQLQRIGGHDGQTGADEDLTTLDLRLKAST